MLYLFPTLQNAVIARMIVHQRTERKIKLNYFKINVTCIGFCTFIIFSSKEDTAYISQSSKSQRLHLNNKMQLHTSESVAQWNWIGHNFLQYLFQHFASSHHQTRNFITLSISTLRKTSLQLVILTGKGVHPITHQHSVPWGPSSCGNSPCILQG